MFSSIIKIEEIALIRDTSRIDLLTFLYFHSSEQAFFLNQERSHQNYHAVLHKNNNNDDFISLLVTRISDSYE